ncbi:MAG TPA: acyloxyacyl hydrolase [Trinickia sp.]|nr:acyloxyacyl hydrolase [Trinickia sp.]
MNSKKGSRRRYTAVAGAAAVLVLSAASAARADSLGVQVAGGVAEHKVYKADLGLVWDPGINWWGIGGWHFALIGEAHVAYWHSSEGTSRNGVFEFGVTPVVRFIKATGAVRPYIEAGAGIRGLSKHTINASYNLSSAFQFTEVVGIGAQFGRHQQYEVGLRFQHISNAGIKEPNPGINFSQLYLQYNF